MGARLVVSEDSSVCEPNLFPTFSGELVRATRLNHGWFSSSLTNCWPMVPVAPSRATSEVFKEIHQ